MHGSGAAAGADEASSTPSPREYVRVLVVAALIGPPIALAAGVVMSAVHGLTTLVWDDLPDAAGWTSPPAWYVLLVPAVGGLIVAGCLRLPGHGGHPAVGAMSLEPLTPVQLPGALAAALATLGLGLVLGPEGPLVALGLAAGLVASRAAGPAASGRQLIVLAGAFATISTVFGGPLTSALMIFELLARSGKVPAANLGTAILPGFLAAGTAALTFTGIDHWPGVQATVLSLPPLPDYPTVRIADIAWCLPVAVVVGVVVAGARRAAREGAARATVSPLVLLCAGGLAVGALAVAFRAVASEPVDLVLFSGQDALAPLIAETSAGVLVLAVIAKGAAYAISLGAGFRGGPTFPAVALGVALGALAAHVLPGLDLTPAVVAGVAAGAAAALELPFFGALLAALLVGSGASETVPIAVLASAIGWLAATAVHERPGAGGPRHAAPSRRRPRSETSRATTVTR